MSDIYILTGFFYGGAEQSESKGEFFLDIPCKHPKGRGWVGYDCYKTIVWSSNIHLTRLKSAGKFNLRCACSILVTSVVHCYPKREYILNLLSVFYSEKFLATISLY